MASGLHYSNILKIFSRRNNSILLIDTILKRVFPLLDPLVLANRETKMQLSLHPNSCINVKEASDLSRGCILLDVRFIELSCFTRKQSGFMLGQILLSLSYIKCFQCKTLFVPCNEALRHSLTAGTQSVSPAGRDQHLSEDHKWPLGTASGLIVGGERSSSTKKKVLFCHYCSIIRTL